MKQFYVTLLSNSDKDNLIGSFKVRFPRALDLHGDWEVALVELFYPYSWNNVTRRIESDGRSENCLVAKLKNGFTMPYCIAAGQYGSIDELLRGIQHAVRSGQFTYDRKVTENRKAIELDANITTLQQLDLKLGWTYNGLSKRVSAYLNDEVYESITLPSKLQYMMGFKQRLLLAEHNVADYTPDMRGGLDTLYIYCSIVESQIVGNVRAPLLRAIHVCGDHGDIIERIFDAPHYMPVNSKSFDNIEITIKSDNGQLVPFDFGKTVAKLHFRQQRLL